MNALSAHASSDLNWLFRDTQGLDFASNPAFLKLPERSDS